jgi:hypothetical protein
MLLWRLRERKRCLRRRKAQAGPIERRPSRAKVIFMIDIKRKFLCVTAEPLHFPSKFAALKTVCILRCIKLDNFKLNYMSPNSALRSKAPDRRNLSFSIINAGPF